MLLKMLCYTIANKKILLHHALKKKIAWKLILKNHTKSASLFSVFKQTFLKLSCFVIFNDVNNEIMQYLKANIDQRENDTGLRDI